MSQHTHLTVGEVARIYTLPLWKTRRLIDSLGIEIPRAGLYRLVPRELIPMIEMELQQRGWLSGPERAVAGASEPGVLA